MYACSLWKCTTDIKGLVLANYKKLKKQTKSLFLAYRSQYLATIIVLAYLSRF